LAESLAELGNLLTQLVELVTQFVHRHHVGQCQTHGCQFAGEEFGVGLRA
jgi:hypothetical protein